jgi:hypothetical protein
MPSSYTVADLSQLYAGVVASQTLAPFMDIPLVGPTPKLVGSSSPAAAISLKFTAPALPTIIIDATGNNQSSGDGGGKNYRKPDPQATGDHTISND